MANKRCVRMQIEGSKKTFDISFDTYIQILRERNFNAMQAHKYSENLKLVHAMERDAEATFYNCHNECDVEYDI
jgi:hypothetical protein